MKKSIPAPLLVAPPAPVETSWVKTLAYTVALLALGCTNTQVRWDATRMRQDVMVYYNDQIMDNLIKAKNHLPFVHVDIQNLTSSGSSQVSGTIGDGETKSFTKTSPSMIGALSTISRAVMRPFAYSVSPQRNETLSITAAPALGSQASASPTPAPPSGKPTPTPTPTPMELTKKTTINGPGQAGPVLQVIKEETPEESKPKPFSIYNLYDDFAKEPPNGHLSSSPTQPKGGTFVPGTLKKWRTKGRTEYYFIADNEVVRADNLTDKDAYYAFCKALFTKGQAGSLENKLETTRAELETVKTQLATPSLR